MKAVIFDMDGVLVKEDRYWKVASEVAFDLAGRRIPFAFVQECKSRGMNSNWEICYEFVKGTGIDYEGVKELFQKKLAELNPKNELVISREAFLDVFFSLKPLYSMYIATSRPRKEALEAVEQTVLSEFFNEDSVYGMEDAAPEKNLKEALFSMVREKNKLGDCIVVGDTVSDVLAGKRLGFMAVGVYGSLDNRADLEKARADILAENLSELWILLDGIK
ncbi:MAG: HAD family hydrolase [archaeon]